MFQAYKWDDGPGPGVGWAFRRAHPKQTPGWSAVALEFQGSLRDDGRLGSGERNLNGKVKLTIKRDVICIGKGSYGISS